MTENVSRTVLLRAFRDNTIPPNTKDPIRVAKDVNTELMGRIRDAIIPAIARFAAERAVKDNRKTVQIQDVMDYFGGTAPTPEQVDRIKMLEDRVAELERARGARPEDAPVVEEATKEG